MPGTPPATSIDATGSVDANVQPSPALEMHDQDITNGGSALATTDSVVDPPDTSALGTSGRPQRRGAHSRFDIAELKRCTCDQDAEIYPGSGVIRCKNAKCVTKWV